MNPNMLTLSDVTGEVLSSRKWSETDVSGHGGGGSGFVQGGQGQIHSSPVTITSTVTTKDQIFLGLPNGKERALSLSGFGNLACREGHTISAVWAETRRSAKKGRGWYLAIYNHATEQTSWNDDALAYMSRVSLLLVAATFFGVWFFGGLIAMRLFGIDGPQGFFVGLVLGLAAGYWIEQYLKQARTDRLQSFVRPFIEQLSRTPAERRAG